jgi:hypothetical protein
MKDFAIASIAALLMAGFYALGSASNHHSPRIESRIYPTSITDTVPRKSDTLNKRMPTDTTQRKDTLARRDSLQ